MSSFLQNNIFEKEYPVKAKIRFKGFQEMPIQRRLFITIPQLIIICGGVLLFFAYDLEPNKNAIYLEYAKIGMIVIIVMSLISILYQYYYHSNIKIKQQKKYYSLAKIKPLNKKQLEALQLIAFVRFKAGFWTDTLDHIPLEVRLSSINNYAKKLDSLPILYKEDQLETLINSWGISTKKSYENMIEKLFSGLHTQEFVIAQIQYKEDWKKRVIELTEISDEYYDSCFESKEGKPKKFIWAWDLWRIINISNSAFASGLITEEEAWNNIYKASELSHYLFDNIEDYYTNIRMGHAFWANDVKSVYERSNEIKEFLEADKSTQRLVHSISWTKTNPSEIPLQMKTEFEEEVTKFKKENTLEGDNPIGFTTKE